MVIIFRPNQAIMINLEIKCKAMPFEESQAKRENKTYSCTDWQIEVAAVGKEQIYLSNTIRQIRLNGNATGAKELEQEYSIL